LRPRFLELIENEIAHGENGHILMKMNALADKEIVEILYRAAEAGVKIDLIVRGICGLRPGGESGSNIRVRSILGRYLEHSRMYRFAHGSDDGTPLYLIGSADMMPRNLDKRVEVLVPVVHPKHQAWIDKVFGILMSDDVVSFEMERDGSWARVGPSEFTAEHDAQYLIHIENSHSQTRSDRVEKPLWG
jgi:polyphosphate kinase